MTHQYFLESRGDTPNSRCRLVAAYILNTYWNQDYSVSKWRRLPPFVIEWVDRGVRKVGRVEYNSLVADMHKRGRADMVNYGFPLLMSPLFDSPVDVGQANTVVGSDGGTVKIQLPMAMGESFPLVPTIDREGFAIADMQTLVELNIAALFRKLVATSNLAPSPRSGWLTDLRLFISECVTAVDMMLHKVHLLAEYRAKDLGWNFDAAKMGQRHAARLADKFRWLSLVSGRPFALPPETKRNFWKLKNLRNHLAHFDPPCLAATLAETCEWLNLVRDVADVLWAIRKHLRQQLSESTIELLLLPPLEFKGLTLFDRTPPPPEPTIGYHSASWRHVDSD
ncbi:MAG: hypothetical protein QM784_38010 [Polyangiaceae bacterium]